jgi:hypothetical protein
MKFTRAMAIFTSDGKFSKRRIEILSAPMFHRLWTTTMTENAFLIDGTAEPIIRVLIAGRQTPPANSGIERERRLK